MQRTQDRADEAVACVANPVADEPASKPRRLDDEDANPIIGVAVEGLVIRLSDRLDLKPSFSAETGRDPFRKARTDILPAECMHSDRAGRSLLME
jgi:hypothetical protein